MTELTQEETDEIHREYFAMLDEQHNTDAKVLDRIRKLVSSKVYENIEAELTESGKAWNYRIGKDPIGLEQYENGYSVWIDQMCGPCGDDYHGTVCMKLDGNVYLIWDFEM
jgi:hypothetical protein